MAHRLPAGTEINNRAAGDCAGCGKAVPLFAGYVLPRANAPHFAGIKAPRLCCVPCSVGAPPSPTRPLPPFACEAVDLTRHDCGPDARRLYDAAGIYCCPVCDVCLEAKQAMYRPEIFETPDYARMEPLFDLDAPDAWA